ncbi:hypothetical protein [Pseudomonas sp. EMN2]|uniref:hypothetical protein n=1 Tax=Pseudomonas sp. EMN2 TaxID=2615212 RepID=UPI00129A9FB0|nr:hypothetical protein [Pseudomonas sp. EMN2]
MAMNNRSNDQNAQKEDDNLDGFRLLVRYYFWRSVLAIFAVNAWVFYAFGKDKGMAIAGVALPVLFTGWFYSSRTSVHGSPFKSKTKDAIIYDLATLAGCIWSVYGFVGAFNTFFK